MLRLSRQVLQLQSLTRQFSRLPANVEHLVRPPWEKDRTGEGKKQVRWGKLKHGRLSPEDGRRISDIFYQLFSKKPLKVERAEGSDFEITEKELNLACREQHAVYVPHDRIKLEKPITEFGKHKIHMFVDIVASRSPVPMEVSVVKSEKLQSDGVEEQQQNTVEEDAEDEALLEEKKLAVLEKLRAAAITA